MSKRVTLRRVNEALDKEFGAGQVELVRGDAYHYFAGPLVDPWGETSVMVNRLNILTVEQWVNEAKERNRKYNS